MTRSIGAFALCMILSVVNLSCGGDDDDSANAPPPSAPSNPSPGLPGTVAEIVTPGLWGGSRVSLNVNAIADATTFRTDDCVTGKLNGILQTNAQGRFETTGTVTLILSDDLGGPVTVPSRFTGQVNGDKMEFTVTPTPSVEPSIPTFSITDTLTRGFEGPLPGICPG